MEESNLCLPRQNKIEVVDSCAIKGILFCWNYCTTKISWARQSSCDWLDQHRCYWEMGAEGLHLRRRKGVYCSIALCSSTFINLCIVLYFSSGNGCCCCAWCGKQSYGCMSGRHVRSEVLREMIGKCLSADSGTGEWKHTYGMFALEGTLKVIWFQAPCHGQGTIPSRPGCS